MGKTLYTVHLDEQSDGRYCVFVPALGCATVGDNYEHAPQMAHECIECHIEGLKEAGLPIPRGEQAKPLDIAIEVESLVAV